MGTLPRRGASASASARSAAVHRLREAGAVRHQALEEAQKSPLCPDHGRYSACIKLLESATPGTEGFRAQCHGKLMCKDPDLTFRVVPAISWDVPEEPERAQPGHDGQWQAVAGGDGAGTEGVGQARCVETFQHDAILHLQPENSLPGCVIPGLRYGCLRRTTSCAHDSTVQCRPRQRQQSQHQSRNWCGECASSKTRHKRGKSSQLYPPRSARSQCSAAPGVRCCN